MKASLSIVALFTLSGAAAACDGFAFTGCYTAPAVAAYAAPVQSYYAAPVVSPPVYQQQVILPQRIEIVRPEYRLQVSQAYAYQQPVVQKFVQPYAVKQLRVQKFVQPYSAQLRVQKFSTGNNTVVDVDRGLFGRTTITEADGDRKTFNFRGRRID